jgi:glycine cleavage system H lipoate-binding protein
MSITHRRNGIAVVALIAAVLTVVILVMLKPSTTLQYAIYSAIICVLWVIPTAMFYLLALNYKKTMTRQVIPDIITSLTKTLQSMYNCSQYNDKQKDIIGKVAEETVVKAVMRTHQDAAEDAPAILANIKADAPEVATEKKLGDEFGIVEASKLIPPMQDPQEKEIVEKTKIVAKTEVAKVQAPRPGFLGSIAATADERRKRMEGKDIDEMIKPKQPAPPPLPQTSLFAQLQEGADRHAKNMEGKDIDKMIADKKYVLLELDPNNANQVVDAQGISREQVNRALSTQFKRMHGSERELDTEDNTDEWAV